MDNFDTVLVINHVTVAKSEIRTLSLRKKMVVVKFSEIFLESVFVRFISDALYKIITTYQEKIKRTNEHKHHC